MVLGGSWWFLVVLGDLPFANRSLKDMTACDITHMWQMVVQGHLIDNSLTGGLIGNP